MSNQGWMVEAAAFSYSGAEKQMSLPFGDSDGVAPEDGESRLELLKRIKKRIATGFYNSDAVIDDIGHGFAQALDQTF